MIASNLVVNGASRFLNKIYCTDLSVSGATTFASVTATGLTVNGDATVTGHTSLGGYANTASKLSVNGVISNEWYRSAGNVGWYSQSYGGGIWMKDTSYIRTYGSKHFFVEGANLYVGSTNYYFSSAGVIQAANVNSPAATIDRLFVPGELRALQYNIQSINNLGGSFLIGPTINVPAGNNVNITAISGTTITATITGSFSTSTFPTVIWAANSKIKISGKIGGVSIGTCDGKLTAAITSSSIQVQFTYGGQETKALTVANSQASVDLDIMIYTVGTDKPIGIYMTSWGDTSWADSTAHNKSSISIYGGTSSSDVAPTVSTPVVRIGNLSGLPAVNGTNPTGWGIYTQHGYFSGMIVSNAGKIGNFNLSDKLYTGSHSTWNHASNGMYIASDGIAGGNGGTWYLWNDGTGKIGKYTFASNGALTTGTGANQAGMGNDTYAFWAGSDTPNSAPFRVTYTGALTSTSGTIGKYNITGTYLYTGTGSTQTGIGGNQAFWAGSTDSNTAPFRVAYGGALVATNATITGAITATSGTIGASNATNKITIGTNATNASIYYGMSSLANTSSNGFYIGTDGIALGKGAFKVTNAGALTATSATVSGTITATGGGIGGFKIDSTSIRTNDVAVTSNADNSIALSSADFTRTVAGASRSGLRFAIGDKFGITGDGAIYASSATVTGTIHATDGEFGSATGYHVGISGSDVGIYSDASTKIASFGSSAIIGNSVKQHLTVTNSGLQAIDKNSNTYLHFSDLRGDNPSVITKHFFYGDGETETFNFSLNGAIHPLNDNTGNITVSVDGTEISSGFTKYTTRVVFSSPPSKGSEIIISVKTNSEKAKAYTAGIRHENNEIGCMSFAEGCDTVAAGNASHAESGGWAFGEFSHAEGTGTAKGIKSHAEGNVSAAIGNYSHAEGDETTASGMCSHSEGYVTTADGEASHAEGVYTKALGEGSHAEGIWTVAQGNYQTVIGKSNIIDNSNQYAFIIGNGDSITPTYPWGPDENDTSNALTVDWSGNVEASGTVFIKQSSGDTYFKALRTDTGVQVGFGVSTQGTNHGIYSYKLGKWLIRGDASNIYVNEINMVPIYRNVISAVITASSVAEITGAYIAIWGKIANLHIIWKNKNAITVPQYGNITNVQVGTLVADSRPITMTNGLSMGDGAGPAWYKIESNGLISLAACEGYGTASRTIAAGSQFDCYATYVLA